MRMGRRHHAASRRSPRPAPHPHLLAVQARFGSIVTQPSGRSAVARAPAACHRRADPLRRLGAGRYCHTTECISTRVTPASCGSASRASTQSAASARSSETPVRAHHRDRLRQPRLPLGIVGPHIGRQPRRLPPDRSTSTARCRTPRTATISIGTGARRHAAPFAGGSSPARPPARPSPRRDRSDSGRSAGSAPRSIRSPAAPSAARAAAPSPAARSSAPPTAPARWSAAARRATAAAPRRARDQRCVQDRRDLARIGRLARGTPRQGGVPPRPAPARAARRSAAAAAHRASVRPASRARARPTALSRVSPSASATQIARVTGASIARQ